MDKESILKMSREENEGRRDEHELAVSVSVGFCVALVLTSVMK